MIESGQFLFYLDSGCVFPKDNSLKCFLDELNIAVDNMLNSSFDIGLTSSGFRNVRIIRKQVLQKMNLNENKDFLFDFPHWQAGVILIRNTQSMREFVGRWYMFMSENYESSIRSEYMDKRGQNTEYIHNGGDQAVLQCMLYNEKIQIYPITDLIDRYRIIQRIRG